jgi:hypothetical protein
MERMTPEQLEAASRLVTIASAAVAHFLALYRPLKHRHHGVRAPPSATEQFPLATSIAYIAYPLDLLVVNIMSCIIGNVSLPAF